MQLELAKKKLFDGMEIECYVDKSREDGDFYMTIDQISIGLEYKNRTGLDSTLSRKRERIGKPVSCKLQGADGKEYDTNLYSFEQFFEITDGSRQPKAEMFRKWAIATLKELVTGRAELKFKRNE